jgi:hypothetical protein
MPRQPTNAIVTTTHTLDLPESKVAALIYEQDDPEAAIKKAVLEDPIAFMEYACGDPDVEVAL